MEVKALKQDTPLFEYKTWNSNTVTASQDQRLHPYGIIGDCRLRRTVKDAGTAARQNSSTVTTSQDQRRHRYGDSHLRSTVEDAGTTARQNSTTPTIFPATWYQNTSPQTKVPTPCSERKQLPRNKHTVLEQSEDIEDEVWAMMPAPDERAYQDAVHKETTRQIARKLETERERLKRAEFRQAVKARIDELKRGQ